MSNNLVSPRLPISSMQMEPVADKVGTSVLHMGVGMIGPMSSNPSSHQFAALNQQNGPVDTVSFIPGSEGLTVSNKPLEQVGSVGNLGSQYLIVNENVGEMDAIWDTLSSQNLSLPAKRKATVEPLSSNSPRQQSSVSNKRVVQMQTPLNSPGLPQPSAPSKRSVQMHPGSNTPGSVNLPNKRMVRNESNSSKVGSQRVLTPKNRTASAEPSPKGQADSFEGVRSKMRETLASALSIVSQPQEKVPNEEKRSPLQAANTVPQMYVGSQSAQTTAPPVQADGLPASSADTTPKETNLANNESLEHSAGMGKTDGQEAQFNYVLPDADGPFNDSFFVKDELLQGNGLSWAWDMELVEEKEGQTAEKLEHADLGRGEAEKVVCSPQDLAFKIEAELFKLFGGVNKKYKEKGRSLMFNLKDRNNPELRERVMSGEISAERLCSMTPEELASKELSQWRMAKAEELAQMIVLPDSDVDVRRLVKKTHKGEYQVEVEQDDGVSVEVSVGSNSFSHFRPKRKEKKAHSSSEASEVKEKESGEKNVSENQDPSCRLTIPADGTDPMQELILDECKDAELGPPRSFEEFIQDLAVDDPFPEGVGQIEALSDKENPDTENANTGKDLVASTPASIDRVDTHAEKADQVKVKTTELEVNVTNSESPAEKKPSLLGSAPLAEHVWEGGLQLTLSSLVKVVGVFRSGEKTSTKEWPGTMEIKGRVRLDAFEKFVQELPMSRSRAVMVVHFVLKEGSSEVDRASLSEAVDSYVVDERLGFGEPIPGVELYFCPPHPGIIELLGRHLLKDQTDKLTDNGLIGVVVWRRPHLSSAISPNSSSHHKHSSKKQNFSSRRQEDKNVNMNLTSKSSMPFGQRPSNRRPMPPPTNDDDDDIPPGFGPAAATREEDDLPEFNFSGNLSAQAQKSFLQGSRVTPPHPKPSRPVDQMRELIYKYGQSGTSGGSTTWNDDDDDIPEWQPQLPQQNHLSHPAVHALQPALRPHVFNPPLTPTTPRQPFVQAGQPPIVMPQPVNVTQSAVRWVAPHGIQPNVGQYYGAQWRQDAPRSRGF